MKYKDFEYYIHNNDINITRYIGREENVIIPAKIKEKTVTMIEMHVFYGCSFLTSIVIPDSVEEIGSGAFGSCHSLKNWDISENNPHFKSVGGCLMSKDGKTLFAYPTVSGEFHIPEGVTEIRARAFTECSSLISIVIPKGVMEIGYRTFADCDSLTSVVIPEGVTWIRDDAFVDCSSLKSVVIPKSVKWIDDEAFADCSSLTSIVIPQSVEWIGNDVFSNCPNLIVYAPKGSKAKKYAKENNIPFEELKPEEK